MSAEVDAMLKRALRPLSGECIICGGGEVTGYEHISCQVDLVKRYAALVPQPPHPGRCASDCVVCR